MNDQPSESANTPFVGTDRHLPLHRLQAGFDGLASPQSDKGRLTLIVRRLAEGGRDQPTEAQLTREEGLVGDAWSIRPPRDLNAQITVMRRDIADLFANGQSLSLFGDNLFVDLDISMENLPPGSRLRVGSSVVEVTPEPHTGCRKFQQRFGRDALRFTALKEMRGKNLRGVHWRVLESGAVTLGDSVEVLLRA